MPEEATSETGAEPVDEARQALLDTFTAALGPDRVLGSHIARRDLWVRVHRDAWRQAGEVARDRVECSYFCFLSGIDWLRVPELETRYEQAWDFTEEPAEEAVAVGNPAEAEDPDAGGRGGETTEPTGGAGPEWETGYAGGDTRFQVIARVYSVRRRHGITIKADLDEAEPRVESWVPVYRGADWHERETWEMFGFDFTGHPRLRNMYLPSGFEGHPLRKDFPLLARAVKPWPGLVDKEPIPGDGDEEG